jgi:NAD(P)-dependent dehydrogenase (short-subunit alcohol dehydrogenase family)
MDPCNCQCKADSLLHRQLLNTTAQAWGQIDGLVNNAAQFIFGKVEEVSSADWTRVFNTNVMGYAFCIKAAVPHMKQRGGSIVNMSSISGHIAQPGFTPYSTSKGAIEQLSKCVALDYGENMIRSNTICPGAISTPATLLHAAKEGKTLQQLQDEISQKLMLKRLGTCSDVANCTVFLLSDEST